MIEFEELSAVPPETWDEWLESTGRARFYHFAGWLRFLDETQPGRSLQARILSHGRPIGYFAGRTIQKYGLRILGSPLNGWTSHYMGPVLGDDQPFSAELMRALDQWVFRDLGCMYFEVLSTEIPRAAVGDLPYEDLGFQSFLIDLRRGERQLFSEFNKGCKWAIHKAQREGLIAEEAADDEFAREYYDQLEDVFAKQRLVPTYPRSRVEALLRWPSRERLLCMRVRRPDGRCIATGIVTWDRGRGYLWGAASWRPDQKLCPNEFLQWEVMKRLQERGVPEYDLGGGGEYKAKYRGARIEVPWLSRARTRGLSALRNLYREAFYARQRIRGWLGARKLPGDAGEASGEVPGES